MKLEEKRNEIDYVLNSMKEYLTDFEGEEYTQEDIEKCKEVLELYITSLQNSRSDQDKIKESVKGVIFALNSLNEHSDYAMIETDQREDLCAFILETAKLAGLTEDGDITEEWREW